MNKAVNMCISTIHNPGFDLTYNWCLEFKPHSMPMVSLNWGYHSYGIMPLDVILLKKEDEWVKLGDHVNYVKENLVYMDTGKKVYPKNEEEKGVDFS